MIAIQDIKRNGHAALKLAGDLTIYTAQEVRDAFAACLDRKQCPAECDLAEVEEIDTAGVQVLFWFRREAVSRGQTLAFTNHSPAVIEVFDLLKVAALFGDPILIHPSR